ncbi:MAG: type II toxin-antitoxin system RelE/ParE family toxin [Holophagaceae bacterium]|nr:type II toxin-antitoxin system RelE/ParE family toxin [Holophagaceae bacterium]
MNDFQKTDVFRKWIKRLKDVKATARINERIRLAEQGDFGDCKWNISEGISELRIHYGPGYRVYFCQRDKLIYWLLIAGIKKSQERDLNRAKEIKRELEKEDLW